MWDSLMHATRMLEDAKYGQGRYNFDIRVKFGKAFNVTLAPDSHLLLEKGLVTGHQHVFHCVFLEHINQKYRLIDVRGNTSGYVEMHASNTYDSVDELQKAGKYAVFQPEQFSIKGTFIPNLPEYERLFRIEVAIIHLNKNDTKYLQNHPELYEDKQFMERAVKINGLLLEYAPDEFKNDVDIVSAAVQQNVTAIKYAKEDVRTKIHKDTFGYKPDNVGAKTQHPTTTPAQSTSPP